MTLPRAFLLDFDGTLVDSEPLHYACWAEAVRPFGAGTDWEDYQRRFVGITDHEAGRMLLSEAGLDPTAERVQAACDSKHTLYRSRCGEELAISDDAHDCVIELASILPVGIVSSSITMEVLPVLEKAALRSLIQVIVCGDHVQRHKPDPEPYEVALNLLNRNGQSIQAHDCLVFEDSRAGLAAARTAGMRVRRIGHPDDLPAAIREELEPVLAGRSVADQ